jgi:hypothetical protein
MLCDFSLKFNTCAVVSLHTPWFSAHALVYPKPDGVYKYRDFWERVRTPEALEMWRRVLRARDAYSYEYEFSRWRSGPIAWFLLERLGIVRNTEEIDHEYEWWLWGRATERYDHCLEYFGVGPLALFCWRP